MPSVPAYYSLEALRIRKPYLQCSQLYIWILMAYPLLQGSHCFFWLYALRSYYVRYLQIQSDILKTGGCCLLDLLVERRVRRKPPRHFELDYIFPETIYRQQAQMKHMVI